MLQGDETMLMRMLMNLIENGIKYGRENGWLKVALKRQGTCICGSVQDNGPGIAPEHLGQVWKRFWQADPARGGSGATVDVHSELGKGTEFTFSLPCQAAPEEKR